MRIDQFTEWSFASDVKVREDGKLVVFRVAKPDMKNDAYLTDLWAYRPASGEVSPLTSSGKDGDFLFLEDGSVLFRSGRKLKDGEEKKGTTSYWLIDPDGGEAQHAFTVELSVNAIRSLGDDRFLVVGNETIDRSANWTEIEEIPFWFNGAGYTVGNRTGLYIFDAKRAVELAEREAREAKDKKCDKTEKKEAGCAKENRQLKDGILTRLTAEKEDVEGFDLDATCRYVAFASSIFEHVYPKKNALYRLDLETMERVRLGEDELSHRAIRFENGNANSVIFTASTMENHGINEDPQIYRAIPGEGRVRVSPEGFDRSPGSSVGTDARYGGGRAFHSTKDGLYFIDTQVDTACLNRFVEGKELENVLPGAGSIECFDVAEDGTLYFIAMKDLDLPELFVKDAEGIRKLTRFSSVLEGTELSKPETFTFESNGAEIRGFVLKPAGFEPGKSYPGLLEVHGGPKTAFGTVLHHEMQMLASEGFFVFYTNPHGSDGNGVEFSDIRGRYGTIDYEDLMTFTDEVLRRYPEVDSKRLGVLGGSYGGFMTNWIIGHTDRFAAANSQRSISNWTSFYGTSDIGYYFNPDQQNADPWSDLEACWRQSPIAYAKNVKTPTLFIHSDMDLRCPLEQGLQMFTAIREIGVDSRIVVFKDETHELSRSGRPKSRIKRLTEIRDWFVRHLAAQ